MANIALFDMDGTIADFEDGIARDLELLYSPDEPVITNLWDAPYYIEARMDLIKDSSGWWRDLKPISIGLTLLKVCQDIGYEVHILTQGPRNRSNAWKEKVEWVREHLGDVDITITRNKGLVYGKVLIDDYPDYMLKWLRWRKNGLGIMPRYVDRYYDTDNEVYKHSQVKTLSDESFSSVVKALEDHYEV